MRKIDIFFVIFCIALAFLFIEFQSKKLDSKKNKDLSDFDTIEDLLMKGSKLKEMES